MTSLLIQSSALFVDLRRVTRVAPERLQQAFALAYIVSGDLQTTYAFLTMHQNRLTIIPHITCEITQPATLSFLLTQPAVTRLSLPITHITPDIAASGKVIDAIIHWDHRRQPKHYQMQIAAVLQQGVTHISVYGLQDFTVWQTLQHWLNEQGLLFYDRFHAAAAHHQSPYQNHIAAHGNIIAFGGWSRVTENGITKTRGLRATRWRTLTPAAQREDMILLGMSHRYGMGLSHFTAAQITAATQSQLAIITHDRLQPSDLGLWQLAQLAHILL